MRQVSLRAAAARNARRIAYVTAGTSLAIGLMATLAPVSQAAPSLVGASRAAGSHPARMTPASATLSRLAREAALTRDGASRRSGMADASIAPATAMSGTGGHAGIVTGIVRSIGGAPVAGACVTASKLGSAASTTTRVRSDGRYLLSSLRPGRYTLKVAPCPSVLAQDRSRPYSVTWPGMGSVVTVRAGQVETLTPATIWQAGTRRTATREAGQPSAAKTGSISGRVTGNGKPIAGVCVTAIPVNGGEGAEDAANKNGTYKLTRLRPAKYQVQFMTGQPFCPNSGNWLSQWYPNVTSPFPNGKVATLRVRAGKNIGGINGKLRLGGQISGRVVNKAGKPVSGICVNINGTVPGGFAGYGFNTVKNGTFALHGVFPGKDQVEFNIGCGGKGNYAFQWWRNSISQAHATTIRITGQRIVSDINATLQPGATIAGTVRGSSAKGKPLPRVCVSATDNQGDDFADTETGSRGTYRLEGLAGRSYRVNFDPTCGGESPSRYLGLARQLTVGNGKTLAPVNVSLELGAIISGKVTDVHGNPIGSICVQIGNIVVILTGPGGSYNLEGVPPGSYAIEFFGGCGNKGSVAPQFYNDQPSAGSANLVKLESGKVTPNVSAVMQPGGTIAGVVTDASGHRLSHICVGAATPQQAEVFGDFIDIVETTNGNYLIQNLAAGPYDLDFNCGGGRFASQWFRSRSDVSTADQLSVSTGGTTRANARLSVAGAISGTVTTSAGKPLSQICVTPVNPRTLEAVNIAFGEAMTSRQGTYQLAGLAPGRYLIEFNDCAGHPKYASQWYRGQLTTAAATTVTIRSGRTDAGINAKLGIGGSISGHVVGPTGKPLAQICVEASDLASQAFGLGETGKTGNYSVRGLATGRYSLTFVSCAPKGPNLAGLTKPALVHVTAPHTVKGANAKLLLGGWISGRVLASPSSIPLGQVCVLAEPVNPNGSFSSTLTGANGRYLIPDLGTGAYHVYFGDPLCDFFNPDGVTDFAPQWFSGQPTAATATQVTVTAGAKTTGISAVLQSFGAITGTVTSTSGGVTGECVTAVPFQAASDLFFGTPPQSEIAISGHSGSYTLVGLNPGKYKVEFSTGCGDTGFATQWWQNAGSQTAATPVTVQFATITGINATLRR